ncbi:uncharacterized protein LOC106629547 isoform X2 [Zonotrichia albicollis]|uniref:uncharacterized protein LOC106629547 isoform X2 n=1 Tax=Zonotrichia albicollis TaxID=44394 RepID=UPI003D80D391
MKEGSMTMACTSHPLLRYTMGLGGFSKNHSGPALKFCPAALERDTKVDKELWITQISCSSEDQAQWSGKQGCYVPQPAVNATMIAMSLVRCEMKINPSPGQELPLPETPGAPHCISRCAVTYLVLLWDIHWNIHWDIQCCFLDKLPDTVFIRSTICEKKPGCAHFLLRFLLLPLSPAPIPLCRDLPDSLHGWETAPGMAQLRSDHRQTLGTSTQFHSAAKGTGENLSLWPLTVFLNEGNNSEKGEWEPWNADVESAAGAKESVVHEVSPQAGLGHSFHSLLSAETGVTFGPSLYCLGRCRNTALPAKPEPVPDDGQEWDPPRSPPSLRRQENKQGKCLC